MKSIFRAMISVMASAAILTSITGCCEDEPYIVVPEPEPAQPVVTGIITTNGGILLPGATVTLTGAATYTALTEADGSYTVTIAPGTYSICASYDGTSSPTDEIITVQETTTVWNALILTPEEYHFEVVDENDNHIEVIYPPVYQIESSLEDMITFDIPAGTVAEDDSLIVVFNFNPDLQDDTKAMSGLARLLDVEFYAASGQPFLKPLQIKADVPVEPVRALFNGQNTDYSFDSEAGKISFSKQDNGRLALDYYVTIEESDGDPYQIAMDPHEWDNYYGDAPLRVTNPEYTMSIGGSVEGSNALLNTFSASWTGLTRQLSQTMTYPIDVTLPVGTKMIIKGWQSVHNYTFNVVDQYIHSKVVLTSRGRSFNGVSFDVDIHNRQHTGGSN